MEIGASLSIHLPVSYKSEEGYNGILTPKEIPFETSNSSKTQFSFIVIHKLIKTLNQEVRDKLRHPQWKHFKHMEIGDSDRARISNIIWRSWHIKFQHISDDSSIISPFLDFAIPDIDTTHKQSESVVLEGQYWCRKNVRVALEYANWRQEFMKRVKKSHILSKRSSDSDYGTNKMRIKEDTGSLFSNTPNDPDFPIFTQNEIDELVMLDMHDTLFTSNALHSYSLSQMSDLDYLPQNYPLPTPFGLQNIQPALDHLHPYYQGYYEPLRQGDTYHANHSLSNILEPSNSIFNTSLPNNTLMCNISQLHESTNDFTPTDQTQPINPEENFTYHAQPHQIQVHKFNTMGNLEPYNRLEWGKSFQSHSRKNSCTIPSESYFNNHSHLLMTSPARHLSPSDTLELGFDKTPEKRHKNKDLTPNLGVLDADLGDIVEILLQRMKQLEEQVANHQKILKPFLEHSQLVLSSPKSNTTTDSPSPVPSAKRFCAYTGTNSPKDSSLLLPWSLPDSNPLSHVSRPFCPSPSQPKYSSDHKRRSGIKTMLEQLEARLPKNSIDGARLSNATLLVRAADYAKNLSSKVHNHQNEIADLKSSLAAHRVKSNNLCDEHPESAALRTLMSLENNKTKFEDYVKERSKNEPKFFIFSLLMRPLFEQFNSTYFPNSNAKFYENLKEFCANYFTPSRMREELSNNLNQLCNQTQFLKNPELIQSDIKTLFDKKS